MTPIALLDYRAGNLTSVKKALTAVGAEVFVPESPAEMSRARGIVVPGVGHFAATTALDRSWIATLRAMVDDERPLLGICLGMQWLYEGSEEAPDCPGFGVLSGRCFRLRGSPAPERLKVPHVGWNVLDRRRDDTIADGVPDRSQVYFTHSFVAPVTADTVAETSHGEAFASIVQRGRIAGVQFHPEKSGEVGLRILRNFVESAASG